VVVEWVGPLLAKPRLLGVLGVVAVGLYQRGVLVHQVRVLRVVLVLVLLAVLMLQLVVVVALEPLGGMVLAVLLEMVAQV
jgi:hypothetical protein